MKRDLKKLVQQTLESQNLGVLATLDEKRPYENLVAFASSKDLTEIIFSTGVYTRKYINLKTHPNVCFLVDTRSNSEKDFHECIVVTALGNAKEVGKQEKARILRLYLNKHPYIEHFVKSPSGRLFKIKVKKYIVVSEFQKVLEFAV